jgi:hypothetical protein
VLKHISYQRAGYSSWLVSHAIFFSGSAKKYIILFGMDNVFSDLKQL